MYSRETIGAIAVALSCVTGPAAAEPAPRGEVFTLDTGAPAGYYWYAQLAAVPGGGFAASWNRSASVANGTEFVARVYSASGAPRAPALRANQQYSSSPSGRLGGNRRETFVLAWSYDGREEDGYPSGGIFARRFDAGGGPLGDEFEVAPAPVASGHVAPGVSMAPDGRFVVIWFEDREEVGLYGRLYDAAGQPRTGRLLLAELSGHLGLPDVWMRQDGSFVLAYSCNGGCSGRGDSFTAYVKGFDAEGNATFGPLKVGDDIELAALSGLPDGAFQVVWAQPSAPVSYSHWNLYLRRYAADGTPSAPDFHLNAQPAEINGGIASGVDALGTTTVAWMDGDGRTLLARSLDRWGNPDGGPVTVGSGNVLSLTSRSVAFDDSGGFLIAWVCGELETARLCARLFGAPIVGPPPVTPMPPAKLDANPAGQTRLGGTLSPWLLLVLVLALSSKLRRRSTGAGRTSGSR